MTMTDLRRRAMWPAAVALAALISVGGAFAQTSMPEPVTDKLAAIQAAGTLKICTTGDYKPFSYNPPGTEGFEGIDIDLGKSLAKAIGVEPVLVKTTWSNLIPDMTAGKCDVAMGGISVTLDRQKKAFFSEPYLVNGKAPIARCADKERFATVAGIDKPDVRVIVNPGGTNERFARAAFKTARIELFPDNRTIFDEILQGRADVMVAESIETKVQEKAHPGLCAINPDQPLQYGEMGYLLPKGDIAFKMFVDQWLHLAKATGEFARLYDSFVR